VGVNLRGHQAFVAQEFLHAADVGAAVQKMRGKTVAQGMRRVRASRPLVFRYFSSIPPTLRTVKRRPNLLTNTGADGPLVRGNLIFAG